MYKENEKIIQYKERFRVCINDWIIPRMVSFVGSPVVVLMRALKLKIGFTLPAILMTGRL